MAPATEEDDILDSDYLIILVLFTPLWACILVHLFQPSINLCVIFIITMSNAVCMAGICRDENNFDGGRVLQQADSLT